MFMNILTAVFAGALFFGKPVTKAIVKISNKISEKRSEKRAYEAAMQNYLSRQIPDIEH